MKTKQTTTTKPVLEMVTETVCVISIDGETLVNTHYADKSGRLYYVVKGIKHYVPAALVL